MFAWLAARGLRGPRASAQDCRGQLQVHKIASESATLVFQPDGSLMLPPLSVASSEKCIRKVLKAAFAQLGMEGKKAMRQYLGRCGLGEDSMVKSVFESVYDNVQPKACGKTTQELAPEGAQHRAKRSRHH